MEKRNYGSAMRGDSDSRRQESTEVRTFNGALKPLMTEEEKSKAQILELSYDFSCRIIRLYKFLNKGKLIKADRNIIDALGRQLVRSATSINANMNEAQHPQSDADFLSKASIALKEARESENWLRQLSDNGYLSVDQASSILRDCSRINKILITIISKVRNRLKEDPRKHGTTDLRNTLREESRNYGITECPAGGIMDLRKYGKMKYDARGKVDAEIR